MKANDIQSLLTKLGSTKIHESGGWVYSSCPLAPYTHTKSVDAHPSFSVAVDHSGISGAKCHACNFSGSLMELMYKMQDVSHRKLGDLIMFVENNNGPTFGSLIEGLKNKHAALDSRAAARAALRAANPGVPLPPPPAIEPVFDENLEVAGIKGVQLSLLEKLGGKDLAILPEDTLKRFKPPTGKVLSYLTGSERDSEYGPQRRLSEELIKKWEILWDSRYGRITIPVRDCQQRLVGHSGRALSLSMKPKYMHAKGFRRDFYLYGESFWGEGRTGTCCVVEGFFDVIRLVSYGYYAGAVMGSHLSEFQIEKLVRRFDNILIVPDGDQPGYIASKKMFEQLSVRLMTHIVPTPQDQDPDDFTLDEAHMFLGVP